MIEYIKGEIVELTPTRMILECGGIGYELNISLNTYSAFGNKTTGKIYIYEVIREDAHLLFGFAEKIERELFLLLTSVSFEGEQIFVAPEAFERAKELLLVMGFAQAEE